MHPMEQASLHNATVVEISRLDALLAAGHSEVAAFTERIEEIARGR